MKKFVLSIALACFAFGANKSEAATWGASTNVAGYYLFASGGWLYLKLGNMQNPAGCSAPTSLLLSASHTRFKELYATILAAQTSGSQIAVLYDGCDAGSGFPLISAIASPAVW